MNNIKVVYWKRKFFATPVINPYLYCFKNETGVMWQEADKIAPRKFLRIPDTALFEYGGTHEEAVRDLTSVGISDIMELDEL